MYVLSMPQGLGITPVYKCTATICYSSDGSGQGRGTDGLFRELQALLNRFAIKAGFAAVSVDGFIGAGTVNALTKVTSYLRSTAKSVDQSRVTALTAIGGSKEAIAGAAQGIVDNLTYFVRELSLPPSSTTSSSSGGGGGSTYTPVVDLPAPTDLPAFPGSEVKPVQWPYYLAGGIVALTLIFGAYSVYKEPKSEM